MSGIFPTIFILSSLAISQSAGAFESQALDDDLKSRACLFERPVVIGASVSSGLGVVDTLGKLVARKYGKSLVGDESFGGQSGVASVKKLKKFLAAQPANQPVTTIFALDAFFWDTQRINLATSCEQSMTELRDLFSLAEKNRIFLVIGNIPKIGFSAKECREKLNDAIEAMCRSSQRCLLRDSRAFVSELYEKGEYKYKELTYPRMKIPFYREGLQSMDGHFTQLAHHIFVDSFLEDLKKRPELNCSLLKKATMPAEAEPESPLDSGTISPAQ